ncbi:phage tail protein, partial [Campylobacter jejuni]|nr:phage tail protein [Campylobacter jejuni]EAJ1011808.1 phage tail protein [Campylobacter jejuni]HEB8240456.1 phage tail protein [Campylobacter jejuni]HEB8392891.1 phage tail protein [Campylobacter jejuni]
KDFTKLPTSSIKATNDNQFVNLATLKEQAPSLIGGLGVNQAWQNVSRAFDVAYTNNTGKPIAAKFQVNASASGDVSFSCSEQFVVSMHQTSLSNGGVSRTYFGFGIIPPNGQYRLNTPEHSGWYPSKSIVSFMELR